MTNENNFDNKLSTNLDTFDNNFMKYLIEEEERSNQLKKNDFKKLLKNRYKHISNKLSIEYIIKYFIHKHSVILCDGEKTGFNILNNKKYFATASIKHYETVNDNFELVKCYSPFIIKFEGYKNCSSNVQYHILLHELGHIIDMLECNYVFINLSTERAETFADLFSFVFIFLCDSENIFDNNLFEKNYFSTRFINRICNVFENDRDTFNYMFECIDNSVNQLFKSIIKKEV